MAMNTGTRVKRPEGVVFDLGGVLIGFDHMTACRRFARYAGRAPEEVYRAIFDSGLEGLYDTGMPTEKFYSEVLGLFGVMEKDLPIGLFGEIWSDIFTENGEVVRLLGLLKGKARLYLLSNTNELHYDFARSKFAFLRDSFEKVFLSYELGTRKPEEKIFSILIKGTGIAPEGLFYIDDRVEHVEAAGRAGIRGVVFRSAGELGKVLRDLGFEIP